MPLPGVFPFEPMPLTALPFAGDRRSVGPQTDFASVVDR